MWLSRIVPTVLAVGLSVIRAESKGHQSLCETHQSQQRLTTETTNGTVTGHYARNRTSVIEFLGIPYAAPPVQSLRFAAPAVFGNHGPYVASNFAPSCPETPSKPVNYPDETSQGQRIISYFGSQFNHSQSEDCLTLNVWTRPTEKGCAARKPVLVMFYGGRWSIGDTITPFYNGQYLAAAEDVVVVTVSFRSNIFGYPGVPGQPSNLALLDQRKAIEWVADNAAAFGGDPSKIIIAGQSSGSVAVHYHSFAFADNPMVSGYISHSGNAFSFPTNNLSVAAQHWYNASAMLGCGDSGDVLPCMRNQTWQAIEAAGAKVIPPPTGDQARTQPSFQPIIDNVTVFTVDEYARRMKSGQFAQRPYMFGNTDNEAGYYRVAAYAQGTILSDGAWANFNAYSFTCPNTFAAQYHKATGLPTWQFRYFGDWDNLRLYPTSGAYHGSDVEMVFGASEDVSGLPETATEQKTQALMMHAWATFADDAENGLNKLEWPQYDDEAASLIELAYNNSPVARFVAPSTFSSVCPSLNLTWYDLGSA